jgi:predicted nucleic acid-binding protein
VGGSLILETTFLVDLERERLRGGQGKATAFLERHRTRRLCASVITLGEMAAGATARERGAWDEMLANLRILPVDREVCWRYGRIFRHLKENGRLIGTNDLWIAATAVETGLPVVTRNLEHFRRVPDLEVLGYTPA